MVNFPGYITYPIVANARDLMQRGFSYIQSKIPGWQPSEGQLDTWLIEATGNEGADIATLTTEVPKSIYRYFGATLFGVPPIDATPATATSTWFLTDNLGHTIPAGTQVAIPDNSGVPQPFEVLSDVIVAGGATQTGVGAVTLIATNAGADATGIGAIGGSVMLLDVLAWVDHVTQATVTLGGQDAETDDDYLTRLSQVLQTMSPRPILPNDFAILSRNVAGVQRSAVLDGYDPGAGTFGHERMVTLVSLDPNGAGIDAPHKAAVSAYLESMREINFVVNMMDPTVVPVDVTVRFSVLPGYDPNEVTVRVGTAISNFLNPQYWGISDVDDPTDPKTWNNSTMIYYLELGSIINAVAGVNVITLLQLGPHGGAMASGDLALTGVVPLPNASLLDIIGT